MRWSPPFRNRNDPARPHRLPPHVSLIIPFVPPHDIDAGTLNRFGPVLAPFRPFDYSPAATARFPGMLYLAPEPREAFRTLTAAIWQAFPRTPPYGGRFAEFNPHLTVVKIADEAQLDRASAEFDRIAQGRLPLRARAEHVALMDTASGRWKMRASFPLGG